MFIDDNINQQAIVELNEHSFTIETKEMSVQEVEESINLQNRYDIIVMNPPFHKAGQFLQLIVSMLKEDGLLFLICLEQNTLRGVLYPMHELETIPVQLSFEGFNINPVRRVSLTLSKIAC